MAAADVPRLLRSAALAAHRRGRARVTPCQRTWHDTPAGHLRDHGLALSEQAGRWRLERLVADPARPPVILAEGADPAALHRRLTDPMLAALTPVAGFTGTRRSVALDLSGAPGRLDVIEGAVRGVTRDEPACRLILSGPPDAASALAADLASHWPVEVPAASLAASAIALGLGAAAGRRVRETAVAPDASVGEALAWVLTETTRVLLHWGAVIPELAPGEDDMPVHQMRVAARRLRAALAAFRRAAGTDAAPLFRDLGAELKGLAATLGAARDWDVFLAGDAASIASALAADKRVTALLAAAARHRASGYAALRGALTAPSWRRLALRLALLPVARPWQALPHPARDEFGDTRPAEDHAALLAAPAEAYAAQALARAFRRVTVIGEDLSTLSPDAQHDARKSAKRLRYACEFFAPLFPAKPVKRFLERLEEVQEALGAVNDGHVAAALMKALGAETRFAGGVVEGFVAASRAPAARRAAKAWRKLLEQEVFWE